MFLSYKLHSNKNLRVRVLITDCTVAMAKFYALIIITALTVKIGCVVVCSDSTCKKCRKQLLASLGIFLMHPFNCLGQKLHSTWTNLHNVTYCRGSGLIWTLDGKML